eukprot:CAMPEP_0171246810 /NCGR_PEP_ID=MMETSP0790-20130122/48155_1 /TAXON_ID=2925 /ORGANISM="Alexandrium catenella, Strain OF101" /LENGTH=238 /DNA_ID=CAMNT_0011714167 /DNA_START=18 /DNA_END=735 /DNA_ORIENTATION=-
MAAAGAGGGFPMGMASQFPSGYPGYPMGSGSVGGNFSQYQGYGGYGGYGMYPGMYPGMLQGYGMFPQGGGGYFQQGMGGYPGYGGQSSLQGDGTDMARMPAVSAGANLQNMMLGIGSARAVATMSSHEIEHAADAARRSLKEQAMWAASVPLPTAACGRLAPAVAAATSARCPAIGTAPSARTSSSPATSSAACAVLQSPRARASKCWTAPPAPGAGGARAAGVIRADDDGQARGAEG